MSKKLKQDGSKEFPFHQSFLANFIPGFENQLDKYTNLLKDGNETWAKTVMGSWVHELLEQYVLDDLRDLKEIDFCDAFLNFVDAYETQKIQWTMDDKDEERKRAKLKLLAENAEIMVKGFIKQFPDFATEDNLKTEKEFLFYFKPCDCWITGTIDLVDTFYHRLADYKTSGQSQKLEATIQHYIYCLGYEAEYQKFPETFTYYNLEQYLTKDMLVPQVINVQKYLAVKKVKETIENYRKLTKKYSEDVMPEKQEIIPVDANQLNLSFNETLKLGEIFAASGVFDDARDAGKAIVKILAGRELGIAPVSSMRGFHIILDKPPEPSSATMAGLIKRSGKYDYEVKEHDNQHCLIWFYENKKFVGDSEFSIEDAKVAGLVKEKSGWVKYPKNMVLARALSNGFTWYCSELSMSPLYNEGDFDFEVPEPIQNDSKPVQKVEVIEKPDCFGTNADTKDECNTCEFIHDCILKSDEKYEREKKELQQDAERKYGEAVIEHNDNGKEVFVCKRCGMPKDVNASGYCADCSKVKDIPEEDIPGLNPDEFDEYAETIIDTSDVRKELHKELDLNLTRFKSQHKIGNKQSEEIWSKNGLRIGKAYKIGEKEAMILVLESTIIESVLSKNDAPWDVMSEDKVFLIGQILREIRDKMNQEISFGQAFEIASRNGIEKFFDTDEEKLENYLNKLKG